MKDTCHGESWYEERAKKAKEITDYFISFKDDLDFVPAKEKLLEFNDTQRRDLYYMCENQIYNYVNGVEDVYTNPDKKSVYDKMCERSHKLELLIEDIDCHSAYSYIFGEYNHVYTKDDFIGWSEKDAQDFITELWVEGFEYDPWDDNLRDIPRRIEIYNKAIKRYNECIEIFKEMGYEVQ